MDELRRDPLYQAIVAKARTEDFVCESVAAAILQRDCPPYPFDEHYEK